MTIPRPKEVPNGDIGGSPETDGQNLLERLHSSMTKANAMSARCLRRMARAQTAAIRAARQATDSLANATQAIANVEAAKVAGGDAGVLSPSRLAATATREMLAVALVELKVTSEDHHLRREKTQNALAVDTCATWALAVFIERSRRESGVNMKHAPTHSTS